MFNVNSPYMGCYVPFARGLYSPLNLFIMFMLIQYFIQKYDGMFNGNSPYKGCYVPFARGLYSPLNLFIMFMLIQYFTEIRRYV